jgi:1-acyl-sn-glycerol-3-phosphate acyltransferase
MSQLSLLTRRAYWPLFWTQFFGAFNDNLFKTAFALLVAYRGIGVLGMRPEQVVVVASGVFILPFLLLSPIAGQLCDKYSKTKLMQWVKIAEVAIMALGAVGFCLPSYDLLLGVLFLMGGHSTFFGPAKYSVVPELLDPGEMVAGNALIELGSFLAILLGTIVGGLVVGAGTAASVYASGAVVVIAGLGALCSRGLQTTAAVSPDLLVQTNPFPVLRQMWAILRSERSVLHSAMGISWFWFLGAAILSIMPLYCRSILHGNEQVVTFCLALFCVGIGLGSSVCERLSQHRLELGLVPLGSFGLCVFLTDLTWVGSPFEQLLGATESPLELRDWLAHPEVWRVCLDLFLTACFGGVFSVPLYTLLQQRSQPGVRSRVIAGNNVLNAVFMVASSGMLFLFGSLGVQAHHVFVILAAMNACVAVYIYGLIPEFLLRFVVWGFSVVMYRLDVFGRSNIPAEGPCILVCNHVTYVDWLFIAAACPRPARFVMYHGFLKLPFVGMFFRDAKVIPIAPAHEGPEVLEAAFERIAAELDAGEVVCLFPEGKLTSDGKMNAFRTGIERIAARTPVPIVPMALRGVWGSFFSREGGRALRRPFRRLRSRVQLRIGTAVAPTTSAPALQERIVQLLAQGGVQGS